MAVNVSVFDLDFPSNPKTVTVDLTEIVPLGFGGEDTWVFSAQTTATASGGASIQRLYISDTKFGWARSSGLKSGPYSITASKKHLKVAVDENISGAVEIELETSGLPIGGNAVASDLQTKISNTAKAGGAKAGNLAYLNTTVRFVNGAFEIISGTASDTYTGTDRSSVSVADGTSTTGLAAELGFDIPITSQSLASSPPTQTSLSTAYTAGGSEIQFNDADSITAGDVVAVTDGTNIEYRGIENGGGTAATLSSGLQNSYAQGSLVQIMTLQDPGGEPTSAYTTIDDQVKFAIASIVNQIDFSG